MAKKIVAQHVKTKKVKRFTQKVWDELPPISIAGKNIPKQGYKIVEAEKLSYQKPLDEKPKGKEGKDEKPEPKSEEKPKTKGVEKLTKIKK